MAEACRLDDGNPGPRARPLARRRAGEDGRDKVCVPEPERLRPLGRAALAESTGKEGKGLVPAPGESPDGPDRQAQEVRARLDPYELGQEFFRWEFAIAVAGSILGINPFDQPDVQAAKDKTNEVLAGGDVELEPEGSLDELLAQAQRRRLRLHPGVRRPDARRPTRRSRARRARARARPAASSRTASARATCTRPGQLHKGGPNTGALPPGRRRLPATSCRSRGSRSASAG